MARVKGFSTLPADAADVRIIPRWEGRKGKFIDDRLTDAWQSILAGQASVADALKAAKTLIDAEIAKG
jgi:hypothetical protein